MKKKRLKTRDNLGIWEFKLDQEKLMVCWYIHNKLKLANILPKVLKKICKI